MCISASQGIQNFASQQQLVQVEIIINSIVLPPVHEPALTKTLFIKKGKPLHSYICIILGSY